MTKTFYFFFLSEIGHSVLGVFAQTNFTTLVWENPLFPAPASLNHFFDVFSDITPSRIHWEQMACSKLLPTIKSYFPYLDKG